MAAAHEELDVGLIGEMASLTGEAMALHEELQRAQLAMLSLSAKAPKALPIGARFAQPRPEATIEGASPAGYRPIFPPDESTCSPNTAEGVASAMDQILRIASQRPSPAWRTSAKRPSTLTAPERPDPVAATDCNASSGGGQSLAHATAQATSAEAAGGSASVEPEASPPSPAGRRDPGPGCADVQRASASSISTGETSRRSCASTPPLAAAGCADAASSAASSAPCDAERASAGPGSCCSASSAASRPVSPRSPVSFSAALNTHLDELGGLLASFLHAGAAAAPARNASPGELRAAPPSCITAADGDTERGELAATSSANSGRSLDEPGGATRSQLPAAALPAPGATAGARPDDPAAVLRVGARFCEQVGARFCEQKQSRDSARLPEECAATASQQANRRPGAARPARDARPGQVETPAAILRGPAEPRSRRAPPPRSGGGRAGADASAARRVSVPPGGATLARRNAGAALPCLSPPALVPQHPRGDRASPHPASLAHQPLPPRRPSPLDHPPHSPPASPRSALPAPSELFPCARKGAARERPAPGALALRGSAPREHAEAGRAVAWSEIEREAERDPLSCEISCEMERDALSCDMERDSLVACEMERGSLSCDMKRHEDSLCLPGGDEAPPPLRTPLGGRAEKARGPEGAGGARWARVQELLRWRVAREARRALEAWAGAVPLEPFPAGARESGCRAAPGERGRVGALLAGAGGRAPLRGILRHRAPAREASRPGRAAVAAAAAAAAAGPVAHAATQTREEDAERAESQRAPAGAGEAGGAEAGACGEGACARVLADVMGALRALDALRRRCAAPAGGGAEAEAEAEAEEDPAARACGACGWAMGGAGPCAAEAAEAAEWDFARSLLAGSSNGSKNGLRGEGLAGPGAGEAREWEVEQGRASPLEPPQLCGGAQ